MSNTTHRALPVLLALAVIPLACSPADPVLEARQLMESGDYEASLAALQELLRERPDDPEVNYLYGVTVSSQGQPTLATWSFRKAMEHPDWVVRAGMQYAHGSLTTQHHEAALEALARVLEQEPENIDALLLRARAYHESRQGYEESLADADRVLELDPDSRDALVWRAVNLMYLDRIEEAEVIVDQIEQRYAEADAPLRQTLFFCAGRAAFAAAKGEAEAADERYRECLALDPTHQVVVQEAVDFYEEQGDADRVLEIYETAHAVDPVNGPYRGVLASQYIARGRFEDGEALLLEATEFDNVSAAVNSWMDLAELYSERDDYSAAASAVKSAIDRIRAAGRPIAPLLAFNYADMLLLADRNADALAASEDIALPQFRNYIEGRVMLESGDPRGALEKFAITLRNWPNNAATRYYAAIAAEEIADFDGAIEGYRYAIRAGPQATDARLRLGRLHAAAGDYERANTALAAGAGHAKIANDLRLEGMRVLGMSGSGDEIRRRLRAQRGKPTAVPALVAVCEGVNERAGGEAALSLLLAGSPDLTRPVHAGVLRAAVTYLGELERHDEALAYTTAAVAAHPEFAPFHEAHGRALLAAGRDDARGAFERADELLPDNPRILEGLGQVSAREGDPEAALALYARAAAADDEWPEPDRAAAALLLSLDRKAEAEERLVEVIERDPYDPRASARLAELLIARGATGDRALALARRAVYFGGGEEAQALVVQAGGAPAAQTATP